MPTVVAFAAERYPGITDQYLNFNKAGQNILFVTKSKYGWTIACSAGQGRGQSAQSVFQACVQNSLRNKIIQDCLVQD